MRLIERAIGKHLVMRELHGFSENIAFQMYDGLASLTGFCFFVFHVWILIFRKVYIKLTV